jgi:CBS domain-containing protein
MKLIKIDSISLSLVDDSIRNAITKLNSNTRGFLVVVDENLIPYGIFTDGDAIRLLINNNKLLADLFTQDIQQVMNKNFIYVYESTDFTQVLDLFIKKRFSFIPVLNSNNILVGVYSVYDFLKNE